MFEPLETRLLLAGEGFTAYNDLIAGPTTHINATRFDDNLGDSAGQLKHITTGQDTAVLLSVISTGAFFGSAGSNPASGTPAHAAFNGFVHFGSGGDSIELDGSDFYAYSFSELSIGNTYDFTGTAVRGNADYTDRWTLVTLVGAESFTAAHSTGSGIVTAGLAANQVAIWTGANHTASTGYVVRFSNINPGADGEFEVVSEQYRGPTPGVGTGNSSGGAKGYALSGIRLIENAPTAAPSVVSAAATNVTAFGADVGGQITATGGQSPHVILYYGDNDGGTNPGNWDHAIDLGVRTGAFSATLDGLAQNTNYFFRSFASNSLGGTWTAPTTTFKTAIATTPAVTTSPAAPIGAFSASLNGSITSTGNDPPVVRLYYGDNDGGTTASAWDHFIEIGAQTGAFSATVDGLDPLTTYHFRAFAQNAVGGAWATQSRSFTTTAIPPLRISEFLADNESSITTRVRQTPGGALGPSLSPDWIEIYNPSLTQVSLAGLHLTDSAGNPNKWTFPAGTVIGPQGYLVVLATSEDITNPALDEHGYLHTNFGISKGGEYLALTSTNNVVIHSYPAAPQTTDVSYGVGLDGVEHFYSVPTPGAPNTPDSELAPLPVSFSSPSASFTTSLLVALTTTSPGAVIRFTTNGTVPTITSPVYSSPINVTTTTQVRAIAIGGNGKISAVASETYIKLDADVTGFTSDLPILVIDTFAGSINDSVLRSNYLALFEPDASGRSALTNAIDLGTRSGIQIRGSSSAGFAKKSYSVEFWNEADADKNLGPLGMPAESDWVLYAPGTFDRALVNNPFTYALSNDVGRYAVRTRWVELYLSTGGGGVSSADYVGLYVLMERITRDDDRVPVEPLTTGAGGQPVTGGFMLKIDRADPGDSPFTVQGIALNYVEPKQAETTAAQRAYITGYMNAFMTALNGPNFADPVLGYAAYIDVDSFIDHHLINVLTKNVDALRLSTYMFKTQNGKLEMGPVWDFDRALDSTDSRDNAPNTWNGTGDGTQYFTYGWWARLFADPNFTQRYIDRWQELRQDEFSIANLNALIDAEAAQITEAQARDYARWSAPRFGGFTGEIAHMKDWLAQRVAWIDSQWLAQPVYALTPGQVTPGTTVALSAALGSIYYTLDGSDPRAPGGGIKPGAILYSGPIAINQRVTINARAKNGTSWSGINAGEYYTNNLASASSLRITELHYHAADPSAAELAINPLWVDDDFDFIELMNVSGQPIDLPDSAFSLGIGFDFRGGSIVTLLPGERVVVASDLAAFQARYGAAAMARVSGAYDANLANGGEQVALLAADGSPIFDLLYSDSGDWPGRADGKGSSLELIDPLAATGPLLSDPLSWRSGSEYGGSPGVAGLGPDNRIVINEVLPHTDPPLRDSIELFNTTASAINIGGWYLSDSEMNYIKFRVPDGTIIPAGGYLVFDEEDFNASGGINANDFGLDAAHGDDVYLLQADPTTGKLLRFVDHVDFGATANGESLGRWPDGAGTLYPMATRTLGAANSGPRIGPVVITEVMYNPPDPGNLPAGMTADDLTYIELFNASANPINLAGWRFGAGVDFTFASGTSIASQATLLVLRFDPNNPTNATQLSAFNAHYSLAPGSIAMRGGFTGRLSIDGETLRLEQPDEPPAGEPTFIPYLIGDEVRYDDAAPWPVGPDGGGQSLTRAAADAYGNLAASWTGAAPSPGIFSADSVAPRIVAVGLASTSWSTPFYEHLSAGGWGVGQYAMPLGSAEQLRIISWQNVNQITLTFSEDVMVQQSDLVLRGVNIAAHPLAAFSYDAAAHTATWTLAAPLAADKLLIDLGGAARDLAGNALDGEWSDGASTQSGNGAAGGAFRFRFNMLPGDANRSGQVQVDDAILIRNAQFTAPGTGGTGYNLWLDVNGSGSILADDVALARAMQFAALPAGQPSPPAEPQQQVIGPPPAPLPVTAEPAQPALDMAALAGWLRDAVRLARRTPPGPAPRPDFASNPWATTSPLLRFAAPPRRL